MPVHLRGAAIPVTGEGLEAAVQPHGEIALNPSTQPPPEESPAHLLGDGGDEGGWAGGGDEGERVASGARRVGRRAQGQPHCDAECTKGEQNSKYRVKRLKAAYNVSSRSPGSAPAVPI